MLSITGCLCLLHDPGVKICTDARSLKLGTAIATTGLEEY